MIVGWSGLPTPWTHFSNIDFPYPEIISAITDPQKSFQQEFWNLKIISKKWLCMSWTTSQKIVQGPWNHLRFFMKWFQGAGTPKLLLVMAKDGRFQNETCDQNDFGRSEVYILNGQKKKDFEKWFSDTYSTSKIISQGWGDCYIILTYNGPDCIPKI